MTPARRLPRRALASLAGALALLVAAPSTPAEAFGTVAGVRLNAFEARLATLINNARTSRGIPALTVAPGTTDVARRWSAVQAGRQTMYHNPDLVRDVSAAGSSGWRAVAENVGRGYGTSPDALFNAYMGSSGHRSNILSRSYRYLGIGWAERPDGAGYNTQVFVDSYSSAYGRNRRPAHGGTLDRRAVTASSRLASFESGWDARVFAAASAAGISAGGVRYSSATSGDDWVGFTVRETGSGSGGVGELRLRDAVDLSRATAVTLKLRATTGTARPLTVDLYLRRDWGDAVRAGTVTVRHGQTVTARFLLPPGAKAFRNLVAVSVSRAALRALDPSSARGRYANVYVHDLSVVV